MKTITLDKPMVVNELYYDGDIKHTITMAVSNTINPTFIVYATCLQYAYDELGKFLIENELTGLYYTYDDMDELQDSETGDIMDNFYETDNNIFIDTDRIYSELEKE